MVSVDPALPSSSLLQLLRFREAAPWSFEVEWLHASLLAQLRRWRQSRRILLALSARPAHADLKASCWTVLGRNYAEQGHYFKARRWLVKATQLAPQEAEPHLQLAAVHCRLGEWEEASLELAKARSASTPPDDEEEIHHWHGFILRSRERWEEAAASFDRSSLRGSLAASADIRQALVKPDMEARGAGPVCQLLWSRAWSMQHPEKAAGYKLHADALGALGRLGEARTALARAWAIIPKEQYRQLTSAQLYHESGRPRDAARLYLHAAQGDWTDSAMTQAGLCLYRLGRLEAAEECLRNVLADLNFPERDEAVLGLGLVLRSQGRLGEAAPFLEEAVASGAGNLDRTAAERALLDIQVGLNLLAEGKANNTKRSPVEPNP